VLVGTQPDTLFYLTVVAARKASCLQGSRSWDRTISVRAGWDNSRAYSDRFASLSFLSQLSLKLIKVLVCRGF
jgi:hypothetical protein